MFRSLNAQRTAPSGSRIKVVLESFTRHPAFIAPAAATVIASAQPFMFVIIASCGVLAAPDHEDGIPAESERSRRH
jgi:hypothetical protein